MINSSVTLIGDAHNTCVLENGLAEIVVIYLHGTSALYSLNAVEKRDSKQAIVQTYIVLIIFGTIVIQAFATSETISTNVVV